MATGAGIILAAIFAATASITAATAPERSALRPEAADSPDHQLFREGLSSRPRRMRP